MPYSKVKLGELATVVGGYAFQSSDFDEVGYPVVRISNIQEGAVVENNLARIPHHRLTKGIRYPVEPGDILIAMSGATTGKIGVVGNDFEQPAYQNQRVGRFLIKESEKLDQLFLRHFLDSSEFQKQIQNTMMGVAQPNISGKQLEGFEIPLPPLAEQKRIARILDVAAALQAQRRATLTHLDTLLQSTFLHLFGDPLDNPKRLPVESLNSVCKRITDGTHQPPKWADEGVPFLFVSNVVDGELDFDTKKFISMETFHELNARCPIELDDILYTIVGSYGNAAMVKTTRPFSFQRHIAHIKPDSTKIDPYFLLGMLQSSGVKRQADIDARGVAQKTLNLRELKEIKIFVPPVTLQNEYKQVRAKIVAQKKHLQNALYTADALFQSLQQRAFRGELSPSP